MTVGYNKGWAAAMIVLGIVNLVLAMQVGRATTTIVGVIVTGMGVAFLLGHQLTIADGTIKIKNAFGMTLKTYDYSSPVQLRFEGKKLFIDSERVKGAGGMMADGGDWTKLQQWVQDRTLVTRDDG